MILLHIIGGLTGLASGAVALSAPKGGMLHRRSGILFVYPMLVLSVSGTRSVANKLQRLSVKEMMRQYNLRQITVSIVEFESVLNKKYVDWYALNVQ